MSSPGLLSALALNSIRGACAAALLLATSAGHAAMQHTSCAFLWTGHAVVKHSCEQKYESGNVMLRYARSS